MRALLLAFLVLLLPAGAAAQEMPEFSRQTLETHEPERKLDITVNYPSISIPGALMGVRAMARDFNTQMSAWAEQQREQYLKDLAEMPGGTNLPGGNALDVDYEVLRNTGRFIGLKFTIYQNMAGSAHPWTQVRTVNWDLGGGQLALAQVFKPNADFMPVLTRSLQHQLEAAARKDGWTVFTEALAEPKNLENFLIMEQGLRFWFDQASVAPGAAGIVEATVPWAAIQGMLSEQAAALR